MVARPRPIVRTGQGTTSGMVHQDGVGRSSGVLLRKDPHTKKAETGMSDVAYRLVVIHVFASYVVRIYYIDVILYLPKR